MRERDEKRERKKYSTYLTRIFINYACQICKHVTCVDIANAFPETGTFPIHRSFHYFR